MTAEAFTAADVLTWAVADPARGRWTAALADRFAAELLDGAPLLGPSPPLPDLPVAALDALTRAMARHARRTGATLEALEAYLVEHPERRPSDTPWSDAFWAPGDQPRNRP